MYTKEKIVEILRGITYLDWKFHIHYVRPSGFMYLQLEFDAPDITTGQIVKVKSRKWMLSPHMTKSEIVQTALKAVLTSVEHEAREQFKYAGRAVFGPHVDVDVMWEVAGRKDNLDMRTGQWVDQT